VRGATLIEPHALRDMCSYVLSMFKIMTQHSPTICDFKNAVAQAICEDEDEEDTNLVPARTRAGKQSQTRDSAVGRPSERITHALVKGSTLGVGGIRHRGSAGCEKPGMPSRCARHAPKIWFQTIMSWFGCVRLSLMVDNATASICTTCC
jgi:hypothetical protein